MVRGSVLITQGTRLHSKQEGSRGSGPLSVSLPYSNLRDVSSYYDLLAGGSLSCCTLLSFCAAPVGAASLDCQKAAMPASQM